MATLIRKDQIRTIKSLMELEGQALATAQADLDQIGGDDLVLAKGSPATIKDLTVAADTSGAALIGITGVGAFSTVRAAAIDAYIGSKCIGVFSGFSSLPAASSANSGKLAVVYGDGSEGYDGVYESNGSTWDFRAGILKRTGVSGDYAYDLGGVRLTNPGATTGGSDVPDRAYIDAAISGFHWQDPVAFKADVVVDTEANLPSAAGYESGSYAFATTENTNDGKLYQNTGAAWAAVSLGAGNNGNLLMLNGGHLSIANEVETDVVLEYQNASGGWDYNDTSGRLHTPVVNEARIYSVTNAAYTYSSSVTRWVLADSSGGTVGSRQYTEDNNVIDGQTVTQSIDALDMAIGNRTTQIASGRIVTPGQDLSDMIDDLNRLGSSANGDGASLVKLEDASGNYPVDNAEAAFQHIAGQIAALGSPVKGTFLYRQGAGTIAGVGEVTFANNGTTITINSTAFPGLQTFFASTSRDWGTGAAGDYASQRLALADGFDFRVEINGQVWNPIDIVYTNGGNLVISLDDQLKSNDLVAVNLVRNAYS